MNTFNAFVVRQSDGQTTFAFEQLPTESLTTGDVLIRVDYSSLNYKDGLAVTGKPGVIRSYPMIPGVDLAGKARPGRRGRRVRAGGARLCRQARRECS